MGHDETVFDVVGGETFKSCLAAVGVNKLAKNRERSAIDWKVVGRRGSAHLMIGICYKYDKQQCGLKVCGTRRRCALDARVGMIFNGARCALHDTFSMDDHHATGQR